MIVKMAAELAPPTGWNDDNDDDFGYHCDDNDDCNYEHNGDGRDGWPGVLPWVAGGHGHDALLHMDVLLFVASYFWYFDDNDDNDDYHK